MDAYRDVTGAGGKENDFSPVCVITESTLFIGNIMPITLLICYNVDASSSFYVIFEIGYNNSIWLYTGAG